jgi:hypothetical protein
MASGFGRVSRLWEAEVSMQRLGAWATSEGEPKPKRGSRENMIYFSGAWCVKTLEPSRYGQRARGERRSNDGASEPGRTLCRVR